VKYQKKVHVLAKRFKGLGGSVGQLSRSQLSRAGVTPWSEGMGSEEEDDLDRVVRQKGSFRPPNKRLNLSKRRIRLTPKTPAAASLPAATSSAAVSSAARSLSPPSK